MSWAMFWLYFGPVCLVAALAAVVLLFVVLVKAEQR